MKTNLVRMAVLAVAAVTMAAPAFAGQTQPGEEMVLQQGTDSERWVASQMAPAKETGSLHTDVSGRLKWENGAKAEVSTYKIGVIVYRIGIDTP